MHRTHRHTPSFVLTGAMVSASLLLGACNTETASRSRPISQVAERQADTDRGGRSTARATEITPARPQRQNLYGNVSETELAGEYVLRDTLAELGPDTAEFTQHLMTLSNPFFKGRSADSEGLAMAGDYIEGYLTGLGLEPAFPHEELDGDYEVVPVDDGRRTYRQPFSVSGGVEVTAATASIRKGNQSWNLLSDEDFSVLGFSGTANVTGEVVFVGYSFDDAEDGYTSYGDDDDLTGKIAVFFRFEPMSAAGKSLWAEGGRWSGNAALMPKVNAAIDRGAAAIVMIHPPGADDPRVGDLPTTRSTRFGRPIDVPVIAMSIEAASDLVEMADPNGNNLFELRRAADKGEINAAYAFDPGVTLTIDAGLQQKRLLSTNVGAVLPGKGSLADEWVIIGAHYDHVGFGYLGGARPANAGILHPGADDNASGTVGLMMSAKILSNRYAEMDDSDNARSILFLAFAAEEMGLLGSRAYVDRMELSPSQVNAMLNMDMIGRLTNNELTVYGIGTSDDFAEGGVLDSLFDASGLDINRITQGGNRSDHANFIRAGIPSIHYFTGTHSEYHQPGDVASLVNYDGAMTVTEMVADTAFDFATMGSRISFKEQQAPQAQRGPSRMQMNVRLGIAPGSYDEDENGVAVGQVFDGTSADEGGVKQGDVLIKWNGEEMGGVRGMMTHLSAHKPGDVANVVVLRDGEEVELSITLKGRDGTQ